MRRRSYVGPRRIEVDGERFELVPEGRGRIRVYRREKSGLRSATAEETQRVREQLDAEEELRQLAMKPGGEKASEEVADA